MSDRGLSLSTFVVSSYPISGLLVLFSYFLLDDVGCKMNRKLVDILTQTAIVVLYTSLVDLFIVNLDIRDKHMYVHCVRTSQ